MDSRCITKFPKLHSFGGEKKSLMAKNFEKCYISLFGFRMDINILKPLKNPAVKKSV